MIIIFFNNILKAYTHLFTLLFKPSTINTIIMMIPTTAAMNSSHPTTTPPISPYTKKEGELEGSGEEGEEESAQKETIHVISC